MDESEYAIVIKKTQAMLASQIPTREDEMDMKVELFRGATVQIKEVQHSYSVVMIHDFYNKNFAFQNNLYQVQTNALIHVDELLWFQLIAIPDSQERANIASDKEYVEYIASLKADSFVRVNAHHFSMCPIRQSLQFLPEREPSKNARERDYDCIIRYIGYVDEIGPGIFYGLELLVIFNQH